MSAELEKDDDLVVQYSVRELLGAQTETLVRIETKLDGKADKSDLIAVASEVRDHGQRITSLEEGHRTRRRAWATAGYVALIVGGFSSAAVALIIH